jgi:hypothetical protein
VIPFAVLVLAQTGLFVWALLRILEDARTERAGLLLRIQAPERVIERDLAPTGPDLPAIPFENDGEYWTHQETVS